MKSSCARKVRCRGHVWEDDALEQKMREQVDEAFKEQISFQAEADYFVRYTLLFLDIIYLTGC